MRVDSAPMEALHRLRERAAEGAQRALVQALAALRAEEAALDAGLARRDASRRREEEASRAPSGGGAVGLQRMARFRSRLRAGTGALEEAVRAQRGRAEEASAHAAAARAALARAEFRREAVVVQLGRWQAARRAAREAAEEEERDAIALATARRPPPGQPGGEVAARAREGFPAAGRRSWDAL